MQTRGLYLNCLIKDRNKFLSDAAKIFIYQVFLEIRHCERRFKSNLIH